jgi:tetratricopeptide (TPR) repeat protein
MEQKRLNVRLLLATFVPLMLGSIAVVVVHGFQSERHARTLRTQADEAEQQGQLERAATCLGRYLVFAPDDNAALVHYGELRQKRAVTPEERWHVVTVFSRAVGREPRRHDLRRRLVLLALDLGQLALVREHLDVLLQTFPEDAELQELLARSRESEGDLGAAADAYRAAITRAPHRLEAYQRLARLYQYRLDRPQDAARVLDEMVQANGDRFEAFLERSRWRSQLADLDGAAQDMAQALRLAPGEAVVRVAAAELERRQGHIDAARAHLRAGTKQHPTNAELHRQLALLEIEQGRPDEALACLRRGLQNMPDETDLLYLLNEVLIEHGDVQAAAEIVQRIRRKGEPAGLADYLDGRLLCRRGRWEEAVKVLEETASHPGLSPFVATRLQLCLAVCQEHLGDVERQRAALAQAVEAGPGSMAAALARGWALLSRGQHTEALEQFRQLTRQPQPPPAAWLALGRLLLQRNQALPPRERNWEEVDETLYRAAEAGVVAVPLALLRADVLLARQLTAEAKRTLEKTLGRYPKQAILWIALARLANQQGKPDLAERLLKEGQDEIGDHLDLRLGRMELWETRQGPEARKALRRLEEGLERFTAEERVRLLARLAEGHFRAGRYREGDRLCRVLSTRSIPDQGSALHLLDLALAELRQREGAEGTWWRYGEASRCLARAGRGDGTALKRARTLLAEIEKRRPGWSRAALLEGELRDLEGATARALDAYRRAFEGGEQKAGLAYRLVSLLLGTGKIAEADGVIRRWELHTPVHGDLARLAAEVALHRKEPDRAAAFARGAVPATATDYRQQLWLGQVMILAGQPRAAERALRAALRLEPSRPEVWVGLVALLGRTDRADEAHTVITDMEKRLPANRVPLVRALCHEALGWTERADRDYRAALAQTPDDGLTLQRAASFCLRLEQTRRAEALLRRMLLPSVRLPKGNRAWARRQLALICAAKGEAGYREAQSLLAANRQAGATVADERAEAFLSALQPGKRAEALNRVEKTLDTQPLSADEQLRLARLYEAEGQPMKASRHLLDLLEQDPKNPEYLVCYIQNQLHLGEKSEARLWLVRLEKVEPDSPRVQALRALVTEEREP